jgi:DNA polymerase III delta subunit
MAEKTQARVVWVSGNLKDRKEALAKIKGYFSSADFHTLDGSYTVAYLEQIVRQESIFSDQRVVIIRDMPTLTSTRQTMVNQLKKLLDDVPDECLVVFDGIPADAEKAISAHVAKIGKMFVSDSKLEPHLAVGWLVAEFAEQGKEIEGLDAQLLLDTSGHDADVGGIGIDLLRLAVQKISIYLGRRKNVTREDIQANIFPSQEVVIWSILDALDSKDLVACYNSFHKLVEKEDSVVGAVNLLYNIALPKYRLLLFLKEGLAQNKSKQDMLADATSLPKLGQSGKDWRMRMSPETNESGANVGQPKKAFADFAVNSALFGGFGGKKATVDLYSRKEIVRMVNCLESGLPELRARSMSDAAMAVMADILFLAACTQVDDKILQDLRTPYGYTQ